MDQPVSLRNMYHADDTHLAIGVDDAGATGVPAAIVLVGVVDVLLDLSSRDIKVRAAKRVLVGKGNKALSKKARSILLTGLVKAKLSACLIAPVVELVGGQRIDNWVEPGLLRLPKYSKAVYFITSPSVDHDLQH